MSNVHMCGRYHLRRREDPRLYYDIQGLEIIVPGAKTTTGIDVSLGWFKYKDLEKLFRNNITESSVVQLAERSAEQKLC